MVVIIPIIARRMDDGSWTIEHRILPIFVFLHTHQGLRHFFLRSRSKMSNLGLTLFGNVIPGLTRNWLDQESTEKMDSRFHGNDIRKQICKSNYSGFWTLFLLMEFRILIRSYGAFRWADFYQGLHPIKAATTFTA